MDQTFGTFVHLNGISMRATFVEYVPGASGTVERWAHFAWSVCLECDGRVFTTSYRTGIAHCTDLQFAKGRLLTLPHVPKDRALARAMKPFGRLAIDDTVGDVIPTEPKLEDVLSSLQSDAQAGDQSFEDFCGDAGLDTDSRKAYATWEACGKIRHALRKLFGAPSRFEAFMQCVEE